MVSSSRKARKATIAGIEHCARTGGVRAPGQPRLAADVAPVTVLGTSVRSAQPGFVLPAAPDAEAVPV